MMGVPPKLNGIIPFVSSELFDIIDTKKYCNTTLHCSVLEIYCEELHDLLKDKSANEPRLEIREDSSGAIHIPTLTHKKVCSHVELLALISSAAQKRIKYKTNVHADSSRSHFIVTLNICTVYDTGIEVTSKLQLVDLAGSECVALSKVQGKNLEEAKFINKSLSSLLDVLQTLRKKEKHVPYRNSKLTRYLSDSLGGNSKFILIVCVSPTIKYITETKQSLKFGEDARAVERGKITSNKMNTKT
ncbi:kinesin-like protein KIF25 [Zophobas morio]|uniref:kinesin-like protein KIF25 n=1 Tax=Zophobas morio TaxID=2755281 RepID=UPI003083E52E